MRANLRLASPCLRLRALAGKAILLIVFAASPGCFRQIALGSAADAVSGSGGAYGRDDDPELVRSAVPFGLKTMEGLAQELPEHVGLRTGLARGFTQYAYAFVQADADEAEAKDAPRAKALRARATRLYLRARDYGLEGLRLRGVEAAQLRGKPEERAQALARAEKGDVELLYWTFAPWAAAVALNKNDMALVGDLGALAALLDRALGLDEAHDRGALHEVSLSFDSARTGGTTRDRQRAHFERALQLSGGLRQSLFVSWAENVLVPAQDKAGFEKLLKDVLAFDLDKPGARDLRLANVLARRRAAFLLERVSDLFLD